jgi:hypothetical protein
MIKFWTTILVVSLLFWVVAAQDTLVNGADILGISLAIVSLNRIALIHKSKETQNDQ